MGTILVTGATGNVGRHVVDGLDAAGATVRAFIHGAGDLDDPASLAAALSGADQLFLCTPNHPAQLARETAAIDAAARAGVRRVVKVSALGAEPGSPLEFWDVHGRVEGHLRASGLPAVVLQPTTFMGMVLASADSIRQAGAIFAPAGDAQLAFTDPRDVAAVAVRALLGDALDGRTLAVTGPELLTFHQVADAVSAVAGYPVAYVPVSDEDALAGLTGAGLPPWLAGNLVTLFALLRGGAAAVSTATVHDVTGAPPRTLDVFLRDHAQAFARE